MKPENILLLLMVKILHYLKDPKLWELWYVPYYGNGHGRIYTINRTNNTAPSDSTKLHNLTNTLQSCTKKRLSPQTDKQNTYEDIVNPKDCPKP